MTKTVIHRDHEPYPGVAALFNGDLTTIDPRWAPREDWIVDSGGSIRHVPQPDIEATQREETGP